MDKLPEQNSQKSTTLVHIIAIISLVIFIIAEIAIMILASLKILSWFTWIYFNISGIIELILLFSLDNAIKRITTLENVLLGKGIIEKNDIDTESIKVNYENDSENVNVTNDVDLDAVGVTFCKECNYQLFPEDEVCPYCGAKVKNDEQ